MDKERIVALQRYIPVEAKKIKPIDKHTFNAGVGTYMVLTDAEADKKARESMKGMLYALDSDFILSRCGLSTNQHVLNSFNNMKNWAWENANDFIEELIISTCGIDTFYNEALNKFGGREYFIAISGWQPFSTIVNGTNYNVYLIA